MGFRQYFPILVLMLLLVSASVVGGQDGDFQGGDPQGDEASSSQGAGDQLLAEARELSADGKFQDAAAAYTKWLAENSGHADFGAILIEAADSQLSIERALELLRIFTPRVQDPRQKELCRASQIDLLEMLGRTEQALGLLRSFPPTPRWLYRQAQMLYQEGLAEEAEKSLQQALKALLSDENDEINNNLGEPGEELEARIRLLQARIRIIQDRSGEAENLLQLLASKYGDTPAGPGILLTYYEFLLIQGRSEAAEEQLEKLAREFPDSPELALARGVEGQARIGYAPMPSRLLPGDLAPSQEYTGPERSGERPALQPPQAAAPPEPQEEKRPPVPPGPAALVQTGSFRDRENAEYMVRDLQAGGFEAGIVEKRISGTLYYRVVIGPPMTVEQAQAVLMKLKDASFEGVLLFPE